jgi:hypothetical protein
MLSSLEIEVQRTIDSGLFVCRRPQARGCSCFGSGSHQEGCDRDHVRKIQVALSEHTSDKMLLRVNFPNPNVTAPPNFIKNTVADLIRNNWT